MREDQRSMEPPRRTFSRRQFLQFSVVGAGAAMLLAGCPAAPATQAPAGEASTGAESSGPTQGGTLRLMGHQEIAGMSPQDVGPSVQATAIIAIHNELILLDEWLVSKPVLAESYEVAEDGLTYTFHLHEGVKFHDGTDFTSADVKYTYEFYRNPDNATAIINNFLGTGEIETPDDHTVIVHMESVNADSLIQWAQVSIVQSAYHAEVGEDTYRTAPIGTGAFKLTNWIPAEVTEMEAFDDHFRGRPNIDVVRIDIVPDPAVRTIALETGDSDSNLWPLLVEDSKRLAEDPNFVVIETSSSSVKHFPLNNEAPQLSDKRVRQAMMYALDRQRIIDELWNGAAVIAHSNLAPQFAFSLNDDPNLKRYEYDPDRARELLDEAGWVVGSDGIREKDGMKLSFTCTTITGDSARRPIAVLAQQLLAEVGIDMQLAEAPVASILEGLTNGTLESSIFNWTYGSIAPDPSDTLRSDGGNNFCSFRNERVDELIDAGVQAVDPEERAPIYHEIQQIVAEEVPMLYLQYDSWYNVFSTRVKGLPDSPNGAFDIYFNGLHKFWLDPVEI